MDHRDHHHHDHDHGHPHDVQVHAHDDHHGHAHDPSAIVAPGPSLLRLSALERLAGAGALSALIWIGVRWAMT